MDDKSIISNREHEIEAELEAERRQANKGTADDRDEVGTATTDAAAPNAMGGGAGVDRTTPPGGRTADYAGAGPGDTDLRRVDAHEQPGETFSPRSG